MTKTLNEILNQKHIVYKNSTQFKQLTKEAFTEWLTQKPVYWRDSPRKEHLQSPFYLKEELLEELNQQ